MSMLTAPFVRTPYSTALLAMCAAYALATMAFVGIHPVLTQVPPKSFRSMIATLMPTALRRYAKDGPACPVPMIMASYLVGRLIVGSMLGAGYPVAMGKLASRKPRISDWLRRIWSLGASGVHRPQ